MRNWGWSSNLAWQNVGVEGADDETGETNNSSFTLMRVDGNVGYAANEVFHVKGGLNLSKITRAPDKDLEGMNPAIGTQISMGVQFNKNVGLDLAIV